MPGPISLPQCTAFRLADSPVLDALATALHPEQGSVVMNLHGGGVPTSSALVALFSSWLPLANKRRSQGFHPGTQQGRAVLQTTAAIRCVQVLAFVSLSLLLISAPVHVLVA